MYMQYVAEYDVTNISDTLYSAYAIPHKLYNINGN